MRGINNTLLVPIPKKQGAESLREYKPISCSMGPIAMRLEKVMGKIFNGYKGAFNNCYIIQENFLVAHKCLHTIKTQRKRGQVFKLDFGKVYDRVNWQCVLDVLSKMGLMTNRFGGCGHASFQPLLMSSLKGNTHLIFTTSKDLGKVI